MKCNPPIDTEIALIKQKEHVMDSVRQVMSSTGGVQP